MEVSLLSFVATCAGIDWDLSDSEIASITSVVFAGELLGSMFWGHFADVYGRRVCFVCGKSYTLWPYFSIDVASMRQGRKRSNCGVRLSQWSGP